LLTLPLIALSTPAFAQATPSGSEQPLIDDEDDLYGEADDIVVVASRIRGQVDAPQPPLAVFDEEDILAYGAASISDLIDALGPQTGSGRGRGGGGRPIILLNGQRISSFREMRNIPPEAIRRMEILPEEVALRFGYRPDQRVMNFILKDNFSGRSVEAEFGAPTRGGFTETEFEASLLKINKDDRFNLHAEAKDGSMLTEAERKIVQEPGTEPTVAGDPDPAHNRSLVADTRDLQLTGSWARGLGNGSSFAVNGSVARSDSRSLSGLNTVELVANGDSEIRTLDNPLTRSRRTETVEGGASFDKPVGGWQLSATVDGSIGNTRDRIDRRDDTSPLVDAAAAGTLVIDGPLPALPSRGTDVAKTRNTALSSLVTFSGQPFRLPAGEASATIKAGYAYTGIRSSDTRAVTGDVSLRRNDLSAGINLGIPLTSRREDVLSAVGDVSLNLSADVNDLSDFGTLTSWSTGISWSPTEKLSLQASYIANEAAPSLSNLGDPLVQTFNVPVYDFTQGGTALVTIIGGGNPDLLRETQRDLKLSANWELPFLKRSSLVVEYFHNRSNDVTSSFPVLTPEIEAAFPDRVVRDASGRLIAIDQRPVTFDEIKSDRLRYGINLSGTIGKAPTGGEANGAGARGAGGSRGAGGPRGVDGSGGARPGGSGPVGGGMMGRGTGQGRWNLSVFHTVRFSETARISAAGPVLDLLEGDALTGGGAPRHELEFEGGAFHRGFGLRLNGSWTAPTTLDGSGLPGSTDLRFGALFKLDVRAFVNFDQKKGVVEAVPFLKGSRLSLNVDNIFDNRQKVTDNTGVIPLSYQPDYMDPRGRFITIDFRKAF